MITGPPPKFNETRDNLLSPGYYFNHDAAVSYRVIGLFDLDRATWGLDQCGAPERGRPVTP